MDSLFYDGFENGRMNPENNDNRLTYGEEEEIIFKCHTLTENVSFILLVALLSGGTGMMINARNQNSYKKVLIEEKDERNKQIKLSS